MAQVLCNLPKPGEEVRYVDVINGIGGKQRLCVDASITVGALTIGGVYIQDQDTGLRADVEQINSLNALIVEDAYTAQKDRKIFFNESPVAPEATITLKAYTVPVGKEAWITGLIVGGDQSGIFELIKSASTVVRVRIAGADRTKQNTFPEWISGVAGDVFEVKVKNIDDLIGTFEATLFGFIKNA